MERIRYTATVGIELLPGLVNLERSGSGSDSTGAMRTLNGGPGQMATARTLSGRESELIELVAAGLTDAQIAARLYISIRTVQSHLDRIRDKTGCRRRAALTRYAIENGLG